MRAVFALSTIVGAILAFDFARALHIFGWWRVLPRQHSRSWAQAM